MIEGSFVELTTLVRGNSQDHYAQLLTGKVSSMPVLASSIERECILCKIESDNDFTTFCSLPL